MAFCAFCIQCVQTAMAPGDGIDNDCDGKIDEEVRDGKDNDGDGSVDEDLDLVRNKIRLSGQFDAASFKVA